MRLRCGECHVWREVTVTNKVAERFDIELDRRADLIHRALAKLDRERMVQQVETMIGALRHGLIEPGRLRAPRLDLEPLVLQVELALEPVHDVVGDRALVAQPHDRGALRLEHLAHDRLVGDRAVLEALVLDLARARRQPPLAVLVARRACARSCRRASTPRRPARRAGRARPWSRSSRALSSSRSSSVPSSCTPSQRISGGSVSPCSTSVTKITANVRKMSRSRCWKSNGSASAAASETAPRMPAQPTIVRPCQLPRRARCDSRRSIARITNTSVWLHTSRVTTTAALTASGVAEPLGLEGVEDHRELQPDQREQERVHQEHEQLPHAEALQPGRGRGDLRRLPADVAADGDRGRARPTAPGARPGRRPRSRSAGRSCSRPAGRRAACGPRMITQPTASPIAIPPAAFHRKSQPASSSEKRAGRRSRSGRRRARSRR